MLRHLMMLDDGDMEGAAAAFALGGAHIRQWMDADSGSCSELESSIGLQEIVAYYRARGPRPYRHQIRSHVREGSLEFVEGLIAPEGTDARVFLALANLDGEGKISRFVSFASTLGAADRARFDTGR